ncbi:nucleoside-diphosphate-sugar epimerase [Luteibacter sp. Sphag1AF]|uniref:SDR family oxidoreductase n=1 Tax=Luteibacter sp. Sphag1AF TaxID=2587031 RepID=UPI00160CDB4C|nr:SDR family oxidoreductase [Luteibacter sp. Sphag1AF]MBB3226243.1 nucleoside-diphosphate-sugar epimerase [Luteibacter sp. Sphag1AF]
MQTILVTGATGFVGSALAASMLHAGDHVVAVSRNDPDGQRTRDAIAEAIAGFELPANDEAMARLTVINAADQRLPDAVDDSTLRKVNLVWHCAADMRYSFRHIQASFDTNVADTAILYDRVNTEAPACKRFYHMSTAYTVGANVPVVPEKLAASNPCFNAYQMTKWGAEHMLRSMHAAPRVPVTLFRPTAVVGHARTGWCVRNDYAFYMFASAIVEAGKAGHHSLQLDLSLEGHPDLVPVDQVIADAVALSQRDDQGYAFEVFHSSTGKLLSTLRMLQLVGRHAGVRVTFGAPVSDIDQAINASIAVNKFFADGSWSFERTKLDEAIHAPARVPQMDEKMLTRLIRWYYPAS